MQLAIERVEASRQKLEQSFDELRKTLDWELHWLPIAKAWALPAAFFAGAFLAAKGLRRYRHRRRRWRRK